MSYLDVSFFQEITQGESKKAIKVERNYVVSYLPTNKNFSLIKDNYS